MSGVFFFVVEVDNGMEILFRILLECNCFVNMSLDCFNMFSWFTEHPIIMSGHSVPCFCPNVLNDPLSFLPRASNRRLLACLFGRLSITHETFAWFAQTRVWHFSFSYEDFTFSLVGGSHCLTDLSLPKALIRLGLPDQLPGSPAVWLYPPYPVDKLVRSSMCLWKDNCQITGVDISGAIIVLVFSCRGREWKDVGIQKE